MRKAKSILSGLAVVAASVALPAHAVTKLNCAGSGTVSDTQFSNSQEYDHKSHSIDKTTAGSTTVRKPVSGSVSVEMGEGFVRLKFPGALVPPLSDGKDAWYSLNDASVSEREISGSVKFNFMNKPKVRIDRVGGQLTLSSGFADFAAVCAVVDPNAAPKF
ncbi:hypothetical protein [Niveibacterium sp. SC-1]|uniref:hypothetical protein n=1 Tax=Niveibacterium sp. SC-1 TaxID=3135646 RepID=UPI00311EF980